MIKSNKNYKQLKSKQSIDKQPSEDFDIVESEPDTYESSSEDCNEEGAKIESGPVGSSTAPAASSSKSTVVKRKLTKQPEVTATAGSSSSGSSVPSFGNTAHLSKGTVQEKSEAAAEREKEIVATRVGITDLAYLLDPTLIKIQFRFMFLFFVVVVICTLIHLIVCYFFNEDLWYKYFPIDVDESLEPSSKYEL